MFTTKNIDYKSQGVLRTAIRYKEGGNKTSLISTSTPYIKGTCRNFLKFFRLENCRKLLKSRN